MIEYHSFNNVNLFEEWKQQIEKESLSYFVQNTGIKTFGETSHLYLYCNRSGTYAPKGKGKRLLKSQGSSKISYHVCTSNMKVSINKATEHVGVEYCSTHRGHVHKIAHLPIPDNVRSMIAGKLQEGVTAERILDDIRGL